MIMDQLKQLPGKLQKDRDQGRGAGVFWATAILQEKILLILPQVWKVH